MKKKVILGVIALILVLGGWWWYRASQTPEPVSTDTVKRGDVIETVSVSGEYIPARYADLSFSSAGVVDALLVKEGDELKAGQPIASLDRSVLSTEVQSARTALAIAVENEKLARRNWGDLSPEERQAKKLATEQARENVRTIMTSMDERVLKAPFDGRISSVSVRENEVVSLGSPIVRLVAGDDFVIEVRVPESDITKIALGMEAKVTFDALSAEEVFVAHVIEIDPAATIVQDVVSYNVKFQLTKNDPRLREGMTADIDVETAKRKDVLTVPFRALSKEGGRYYAEIQKAPGVFERVEVTIGLEGDEGTIEIKSGLKEGDVVTIGAKQAK